MTDPSGWTDSNKWFCNVSTKLVSYFEEGSSKRPRKMLSMPPAFTLKLNFLLKKNRKKFQIQNKNTNLNASTVLNITSDIFTDAAMI